MALGRRLSTARSGVLRGREGRDARGGTFLLGAGAHLAGVTALHGYLAASPHCEPGPHREYHVLDSAGVASEEWVRDLLLDRARASLEAARTTGLINGRALQRVAMIADPDIYFDHFAGLLTRPGIRLSMDLTPEHQLLSGDQLDAVRQGFESRGVRVAALLVMRDPLDRIVTHLRLQRRQRPDRFPEPLVELVERLHADPVYESRTRYEHTVAALDAAFEPGQVWFGFHERLMHPESLISISNLCRIPFREPEPDTARPRPTDTAGLPPDLAQAVVEHYRDTYLYVADRFGLDDLVTLWPSARWVLGPEQ